MICLIHPPHVNSTDDRLDPPLGLLYIASHLIENRIPVKICDLSGLDEHIWNIPFAHIYGITVYITSVEITKKITKICKIINPEAKIVVGGAHPTARPNDFIDIADHIVVGNGEKAMIDISNGLNSKVIYGEPPSNYFVLPAYDLIDINTYHRKIGGRNCFPYLTSRGCPFKCSFCGLAKIHKLGNGVKMADPETVINHLWEIKFVHGIDRIAFQDDIFTLKRDRLRMILNAVKNLNIKFRCMGRAGYDTEETYEMLADAGCEQVSWGIESGSQYILDRMNKKVTVEDNYNVIQWAKKYGITSRSFFIIGFPGETRETLEETKRFIERADPDQYFASNFIPYPGTEVGDNPEKFGILNMDDDFNKYYQVSRDGTGGITIDTEWLSRKEFREIELEFREWLSKRHFRGSKQIYEEKMNK